MGMDIGFAAPDFADDLPVMTPDLSRMKETTAMPLDRLGAIRRDSAINVFMWFVYAGRRPWASRPTDGA
jgi:hypothetical protein